MNLPRLLLADDHTETRNLLRCLLEPEFDVVEDVTDGQALVVAAKRLSPDVIVTDISMPGVDGITATAAILRTDPTARIVLVTVHADRSLVDRGLSTGALGYVMKLRAGDDLVPAVHAALRGERYASQTFAPPRQPDQDVVSGQRRQPS
jgi:DNA-binding NarL/FixJ family response regulator